MRVRFVFRATKVYTLLLDYLNHPDFMVDGINRSLEMEVLAKGLLVDISKKYIFWDVLNDELAQLESNDIPYYFTNTSDISLQSNRGLLYDSAFQYSGESKIFSTLTELNPEIVEFQSKIILNSVSTDILDLYGKTFTPYDPNSKFCISDKDKIEKILVDIFQRITDSMIEVDSRITWVGYVSNVVSHTYGYKPVGLDIANGNMGVAIFLCALYAYTGDRKYIEKLDFIVAPIIDVLSQEWSRKEFLDRFGTGITTGIGSIIYGFLKIYEYSGDNKYLEHALSFVSIIKTTDIEKSIRQDVVSGNAGLLLALSKLHEFYESSDFDILVERCLDTIVQTGFQDNRFVNWDYQQNKKLVGFSHGSSGILYALSKFSHHLSSFGNPLKIFENIIDYEYGFYDAKQNNWYDLRFDIPELDVVSWCHGALGVGMSRLNFFKSGVSIDNKVPRDIKNSLDKTVETGGHFLDTLCCGNSGRIDFFLELQNTSFYEEAADKYLHWLVNNMISNYESSGDFTYFSKFKTSDINVGFFQGLSGIGYELLRFLDPKKFSSILLFK